MKLFPFFILLFLIACQSDNATIPALPEQSFFSLKSFFKQEISTLEKEVVGLKKKVTINDNLEEQQKNTFELSEELAIFINADINKPAWLDQYRVDSILDNQQLKEIHYSALKDNLKTKKLSVYFENNKVTHLEIQKGLSNMAAASTQKLTYYTGKGYAIENEQLLLLSEPQSIAMEVNYLLRKE